MPKKNQKDDQPDKTEDINAEDTEDIEEDAAPGKKNNAGLKKTLIIASAVLVVAVGFFMLLSEEQVVFKSPDGAYTEQKVQEVVSEVIKRQDETIQAIKGLESKIEQMQAGKGVAGEGDIPGVLREVEEMGRNILRPQVDDPQVQIQDMQQPVPAPRRPVLKKQELSFMQQDSPVPDNNVGGIVPVAAAATRPTPEKRTAFLPAATLVEGVMVTGAFAPVKEADAALDAPAVLIRLTRNGITANFKTVPIKDAFILAKAEGIWNLERVVMETKKLVMVLDDGRVIETPIRGQIQSGVDGIDGVPGKLVNPGETGRVLKFLGGTTMSGIFAAMGQTQRQVRETPFGTVATIDDELMYALATGVAKTWDNFSQWYLEQAKRIKPFVAVEPGQKVYVLIQEGVKLDV
jgi:hypothetical protein